METRAGADVLRRELHARFITGDGLVLRAVVAEQALHLLHAADRGEVAHKQSHFHEALEQRARPAEVERAADEPHEERGQEHKQRHGQSDSEHRRRAHDEIRPFFAEFLIDPFVEARQLLLFLRQRDVGALGEIAVAHDKRFHEAAHAAHERPLAPRVGFDLADLGVDAAVRLADGHGDLLRAAHHHTLQDGLASDARFECTGFCTRFLRHCFRSLSPARAFFRPFCTAAGARSRSCRAPARSGSPHRRRAR